jgi:hypothetical protein
MMAHTPAVCKIDRTVLNDRITLPTSLSENPANQDARQA